MAILKNTTIAGTGQITIPSGNTVSRPYVRPVLETFTSVGSTTWTAPATVNKIEVLVVAGGGGGGLGYYGGGGGAGGVVYRDEFAVTPGQGYTVTVGGGGAAGPNDTTNGGNGGNSVFGTLTALGGGGGNSRNASGGGRAGGSGGGGARPGDGGGAGQQPGSASGGFGNAGGSNITTESGTYGAGGGGAGQPGQIGALPYGGATPRQNTSLGAPGGDGIDFSFMLGKTFGDNGFFGGGGGGGSRGTGEPVTGGKGGGGDGGEIGGATGSAGAANTGGGGGGGGDNAQAGGNGGSGFVAIRYYLSEDNVEPEGLIRFNTDINELEVYEGSARKWVTQDPNKNYAGGNFLRHTLDYTNAVWVKTNGITSSATSIVDPDGNRNAVEWSTSSGGSYSRLRQSFTAVAGRKYTTTLYVKRVPGEYRYCMIYCNWVGRGAYFDIEDGVYVGAYSTSGDLEIHDIYPAGDGWWRLVCGGVVATSGLRYPELFIHNTVAAGTSGSIQDTTAGRGMYTYGWTLEEFVGSSPSDFTATYDVAAPTPVTGATHTVHEFTEVGTTGFRPSFTGNIELLVVGGGGGGGARGGGGGAGGLIYKTDYPVVAGKQYTVTVGNGGVGSSSTTAGNTDQMGTNGQDSRFGDLVAVGGGGGGGFDQAGRHGGSGGGPGRDAEDGPKNQPGRGIEGQGHRGGFSGNYGSTTNVGCSGGGGGGGAGGPGGNGTTDDSRTGGTIVRTSGEWGGNGGPGLPVSITGSTRYYAGGGGGGNGCNDATSADKGVGGIGGGGDGNDSAVRTATAGAANTGGGGGGGGDNPQTSAQGGSGIVIVRYKHQ